MLVDARLRDDLLHGADGHLAVAAVLIVLRLLESVRDPGDFDAIDRVKRAIEVFGIGALDLVHLAVAQRQIQIRPARGIGHTTRVGHDDPAPVGVPQIVNRHITQGIVGRIDAGGAQKELPRDHLVDHLFLQLEGRLLALDVHEQGAQCMIGAGQELIVPRERDQRDERGAAQYGQQQPPDADPARLHRRDFVVGGEVTECVQYGDQHSHRQRHRHDERDRECEHLEDDAPGQPLADEIAELLGDLVDEHRARERRERVSE